jgi:flagellar basal-body rod modification protein FlgD
MTTIDQLFPASSIAGATAGAVAQPKKQLGQEDFMKLLVAQMNNQDPNNPADNGAFLAQMAQLSMVSGINKLGTSFDSVAGSLSSTQAMQAVSMVGHQVLTDSNIATLEEGKSVQGQLSVPDATAGLNIQVRDSAGSLVKTIPSAGFQPGLVGFGWDGTNERGEAQPAGDYSITATALVNGKQQAVPLQLYNTVQSVTTMPGTSDISLQLSGHQSVKLSQISQYR